MPINYTNAAETTILISEISFKVFEPFAEGHTCSANEAAALNQLLAENLRNNFRRVVAAEIEKAKAEGRDVDIDGLRAKFHTYMLEYEFGGQRRSSDPVEAEARAMATEIAKDLIRAKGFKISDYRGDKLNVIVDKILEAQPQLYDTARQTIENRKQVGAGQLESLSGLL